MKRLTLTTVLVVVVAQVTSVGVAEPPYPPSSVIKSITWHWDTHTTAAPGSDLWPVTWASDGDIYVAWGDGGGFGGTNSDGRVSMGFARITGAPESYVGINVNGGKNPEAPASFPKKCKTGGILSVDGTLYARLNLQDGKWPDVNFGLAWSEDMGATWTKASWVFPKGAGNFKLARFLNFGRDYAGVPAHLAGFVYFYGFKHDTDSGSDNNTYMGRVPQDKLKDRSAYEFYKGLDANDKPIWTSDVKELQPVFADPNGTSGGAVVYNPGIKRYILTSFHTGPGQLGVFDAPQPWGPWTTVAYYDSWGNMGTAGFGLNCDFPQKWMSTDGLTMWSIFSVYGDGARKGIDGHDKFNLVKATLMLLANEDCGNATSAQTILAMARQRNGALADKAAQKSDVVLPYNNTNPVMYDNDFTNDYVDWYLMALASAGDIKYLGISTSSSVAPYNDHVTAKDLAAHVAKRRETVRRGRNSGFRHVPNPIPGTKGNLIRPASGRIKDTRPLGSPGSRRIIEEAGKATPTKPLVVCVGGPLTVVADAYLLDNSIADKVVVAWLDNYNKGMTGFNGWSDGWAAYIVLQKLRLVQFTVQSRPFPRVTKSRLRTLPESEAREYMLAIETDVVAPEGDADGPPAISLMRPDYIRSAKRVSFGGWTTRYGHDMPLFRDDPNGRAIVVTAVDRKVATEEWWRAMKNPAAWHPTNGTSTQSSENDNATSTRIIQAPYPSSPSVTRMR